MSNIRYLKPTLDGQSMAFASILKQILKVRTHECFFILYSPPTAFLSLWEARMSLSRFSLVTSHRSLAIALILTLIISGCENNEEIVKDVTPDKTPPNYYPMSVGSRWVYRNPDGSEWARQVTETNFIESRQYKIFSYSPPIGDDQLNFLKSPAYEETRSHLLLLVGNDVRDAMKDIIYGTREAPYLSTYKTIVDTRRTFVILRFPIAPDNTWETLNIRLYGSFTYGEKPPSPPHVRQVISFEADWVVSARTGQLESVKTAAGTFEHCLKVEYEATQRSVEVTAEGKTNPEFREGLLKTRRKFIHGNLTDLFTNITPRLGLHTVWLAPGVGPVKIDTPNGIAELIDYEIK